MYKPSHILDAVPKNDTKRCMYKLICLGLHNGVGNCTIMMWAGGWVLYFSNGDMTNWWFWLIFLPGSPTGSRTYVLPDTNWDWMLTQQREVTQASFQVSVMLVFICMLYWYMQSGFHQTEQYHYFDVVSELYFTSDLDLRRSYSPHKRSIFTIFGLMQSVISSDFPHPNHLHVWANMAGFVSKWNYVHVQWYFS